MGRTQKEEVCEDNYVSEFLEVPDIEVGICSQRLVPVAEEVVESGAMTVPLEHFEMGAANTNCPTKH